MIWRREQDHQEQGFLNVCGFGTIGASFFTSFDSSHAWTYTGFITDRPASTTISHPLSISFTRLQNTCLPKRFAGFRNMSTNRALGVHRLRKKAPNLACGRSLKQTLTKLLPGDQIPKVIPPNRIQSSRVSLVSVLQKIGISVSLPTDDAERIHLSHLYLLIRPLRS